MRTFIDKSHTIYPAKTAKTSSVSQTGREHVYGANSALPHRRSIGNPALLPLLRSNIEPRDAVSANTALPCLSHDLNRAAVPPANPGMINTKLTVSVPGDQYEQEADRIAAQVMRTPRTNLAGTCGRERFNWQPENRAQNSLGLRAKHGEPESRHSTEAPPNVLDVLRSPGRPLDASTRAFLEARFGFDFSHIRVHSGAAAEQSARDINARAYTVTAIKLSVFGDNWRI